MKRPNSAPRPSAVEMPRRDGARWPAWAGVVGLFAVAWLVYAPVLRAGFVWNDRDYVTAPGLQSMAGLGRIWFEVGATEQYYPVLHSAFWLEHRLWGDAAAGYHAANVVLHVIAAGLLVALLRRLRVPGAWLAGLLFVVHPVMVESVAWVAEQKNTLSVVFYLAAMLAYLRWSRFAEPADESPDAARPDPRPGRNVIGYAVAFGLFLLALLSKSVTATLPAALLVIAWWRNGRLTWRRDVHPLIPWFVVAASVGLFTAWVEKTYLGAHGADFDLTLLQRTLLAGRVACFYVTKLLWPANLMFIYPRWRIEGSSAAAYACLAVLAAVLVALWRWRRMTRAPLAAALFFLGSLFPVLGFFNVYGFVFSYVADHWQYLPSLGVIVLIAAAMARATLAPARATRVVARGGATAVVVALGFAAHRQCAAYIDVEQFYRTIIANNPECWMAWNNLGIRYAADGNPAEALPLFERALQLRPTDADVEDNLGGALRALGRDRAAVPHYAAAVRLRPAFVAARLHLAAALDGLGQGSEALTQYREALKLNPSSAEVWNDYGALLLELGRLKEAVTCYERAIALRPDFAGADMNLGTAQLRLGDSAAAVRAYERAVKLTPRSANAHGALGIALAQAGKLPDAVQEFRTAVQLQPASVGLRANLAHALQLLGRTDDPAATP